MSSAARPVAILVRSYHPLSGVGSDIDGMRAALVDEAAEVEVFANAGARPMDEYYRWREEHEDAVTIYHHAIAWPEGVRAFLKARGPRVMRYHNVTPPRFFFRYSLKYVGGALLGQWQARHIATAPGIDLYLGASEYSTLEIAAMGATPANCHPIPPFETLAGDVEPDPEILERLRKDSIVNLLFVGRLLPHKGHRYLIRAVAAWRARFSEPVRLCLVGGEDPRLARYPKRLRDLADKLGVGDAVELAGQVDAAGKEAYYRAADAFVVASEHEGFCLPVLEAMRRKIPIVAVARSAVPETVGPAALVLPDFDPSVLAEAARNVALLPTLNQKLIQAGREQATTRFHPEKTKKDFLELVRPHLR